VPEHTPDPRVYFAAERTILAWLRTGITIMAFGFVVARFGLFLRLLHASGDPDVGHGMSSYLGAALVGLGIVATAGGAVQFQQFCRTLTPAEMPRSASPRFVLALSWTLAVMGAALAMILLT
jgi:putative membrane protein